MSEIELEKIIKDNYEDNEVKKIMDGFRKKRKVSLRVNTLKGTREEVLKVLDENNIQYKDVSWYQEAFIIDNALEWEIKELDIYKEGKIYLQSLSAMIPALILNPKANESILDMTAAPGGKTTLMAALSDNKALITAVEKNKIRCERLKYNVEKLGAKKVAVLNMDARKLSSDYKFDKILLDAPCSGAGTLYIDDGKVMQEFSGELIKRSQNLQEELFRRAVDMLNKGGLLVYATCSILKEENEKIIDKFIKEGKVVVEDISLDKFLDVPRLKEEIPGVLVVAPTGEYEGFFVASLRKL